MPRSVGFALGLAAIIVVAEYLARRVLAPALPVIGSPTVNDMLASTLCYGLLVALATRPEARSPAALGQALLTVVARAGSWWAWAGGLLFLLSVVLLMMVDGLLWGGVQLPALALGSSETVLFAGLATPLAIAALLLVNGVVIPLAEERVWRGLIQPGLFMAWGLLWAVLTTSMIFSLKHAIVDASLGRLIALTVGGLVLGLVAHRAGGSDGGRNGWQTTAVSHMLANLAGTSVILATSGL